MPTRYYYHHYYYFYYYYYYYFYCFYYYYYYYYYFINLAFHWQILYEFLPIKRVITNVQRFMGLLSISYVFKKPVLSYTFTLFLT